MICKNCGSEVEQGSRFCGVCGTAVEASVNNVAPNDVAPQQNVQPSVQQNFQPPIQQNVQTAFVPDSFSAFSNQNNQQADVLNKQIKGLNIAATVVLALTAFAGVVNAVVLLEPISYISDEFKYFSSYGGIGYHLTNAFNLILLLAFVALGIYSANKKVKIKAPDNTKKFLIGDGIELSSNLLFVHAVFMMIWYGVTNGLVVSGAKSYLGKAVFKEATSEVTSELAPYLAAFAGILIVLSIAIFVIALIRLSKIKNFNKRLALTQPIYNGYPNNNQNNF